LYGYGWWMRRIGNYQTYFAWGFGGQYIFIVPELRVVIATTSATSVGEERRGHRRALFDLIEQLLEGLGS
jgi:CubicO group peptidase (beta-lactamase class C family)